MKLECFLGESLDFQLDFISFQSYSSKVPIFPLRFLCFSQINVSSTYLLHFMCHGIQFQIDESLFLFVHKLHVEIN